MELFFVPPSYQCLNKPQLMKQGTSFRKWVNNPKNLYISHSIHKYMGKSFTNYYPKWYISQEEDPENFIVKTNTLRRRDRDQYEDAYKTFIRRKKHHLLGLSDMTLGCWCQTVSECHASFIIELFKERVEEVGGIILEGEVMEGDA